MKTHNTKMKGKKVLSMLLALIMVLSVASPSLGIVADAFTQFEINAGTAHAVELAFNNLFVFEKWANNVSSTTVGGTLETDIENGSLTITKTDLVNSESYTVFSDFRQNTDTQSNYNYYMMEAEPATTYTFSYNLSGDTIGSLNPHVAFYNSNGEYLSCVVEAAYTQGDISFEFTTPGNAAYIQVRFGIYDANKKQVSATVKNISICRYDVDIKNLFSFNDWADNEKSSTAQNSANGEIAVDKGNETIKFSTTSDYLYTGFSNGEPASNKEYYKIDVQGSTGYTLTYDITNISLPGAVHLQPFIIEMDSEYNRTRDWYQYNTPDWTGNRFVFTTQANTAYIQVVFAAINGNGGASAQECTVSGIGLYEKQLHRKTYDYEYKGTNTYGTLPEPTAPAGMVFAGWYTGLNGTGKLITADTPVDYTSHTVYSKFEPKVDEGGLEVIKNPNKTEYTVGERFNPAGLVLKATVTTKEKVLVNKDTDGDGVDDSFETTTETRVNTYNITSGFVYSPQNVGTTPGKQNITITYGGQTVTVPVTVIESERKDVIVNGTQASVPVANNEYNLNITSNFNRYELTYYSDSYVKGTLNTVAADGTIVSEEFFLEPSNNGSFASYIDGFLDKDIYTNIATIKFEVLNKEFGTFELYSVETIQAVAPDDNMQYQSDETHKLGIDLYNGGSIAYLEELSGDVVAVAYGEDTPAEVDYKSKITGGTQYESVNLINRHDPGRYVQQSYYGTSEDPYVQGHNGVQLWNYNPVQGGNYQYESSKIIDYRITEGQIYVKARPLDWAKYSDEFATNNPNDPEVQQMGGPVYGDDYITDSYMEAWYVFENEMIKTYCRFVDFSGYPSATVTQELPAFYCVEPLNTFAYYNGDAAWEEYNSAKVTTVENPDFWAVSDAYNDMLEANGKLRINPRVESKENWAAFMSSTDPGSFGIGIYSAGVTRFDYGTHPQIYEEPKNGSTALELNKLYPDHADMYEEGKLTMPDMQDATSYISPVDTMTFESYKPFEYSYYLATGTLEDIREDFKGAANKDETEAASKTTIAVPETVYMKPADGASKIGQYYVNNIITDDNTIETEAENDSGMYLGFHVENAKQFSVEITNVDKPFNDIYVGDANPDSNNNYEYSVNPANKFDFNVDGTVEYTDSLGLYFSGDGLEPGEKATAKWEITVYFDDDSTKTYTAYTVMYAPERTVGAVAEGRYDRAANTEISTWITGANGVDHSQRAPLGSFHGDKRNSGYFKNDPLVYPDTPPTGGSSETPNDYILGYGTQDADDYTDSSYVMQTATNGSDGSRSQSYLGLLTVDKSRYTNTNQVPNLKMGYDVLRVGSAETDSLETYTTYYTLGTAQSYTSTSLSEAPSGWTQEFTGTELAKGNPSFTNRRTVVPSYSVSDIDGKYIHALNQSMTESMSYSGIFNITTIKRYATAGTSVLCSVTDKGALRDAVTEGYGLAEEEYSEDSYSKLEKALEKAGSVLGDPSSSQEKINEAEKDLNDAIDTLVNVYYSLKYDNLFSAYEFSQNSINMTMSNTGTVSYDNGKITIVNEALTTGNETYTKHDLGSYRIKVEPNTKYVFEYDVTTDVKAQAFLFFYDENGSGVKVTDRSVQIDSGTPSPNTEDFTHFGIYPEANKGSHYVMRFTTGDNIASVGFRFGNTNTGACESTFSNIRLVDDEHYHEDVTYGATESVYKEHASYGSMTTVTRAGYTFGGWKDVSGNAVTGADIATENKSVYSTWTENSYTIKYDANGGSGSVASETVKYTGDVTLANGGFTREGYTLKGWSKTKGATVADYSLGGTTNKIAGEGTVTLYAVWSSNTYDVTFDNLINYPKFAETLTTDTTKEITKTEKGFTITSLSGTDVSTGFNYYIPVESGKTYTLSADVEFDNSNGSGGYDIYINTRNSSRAHDKTSIVVGGTGNTNYEGSSKEYIRMSGQTATDPYITFKAGESTAYILIRFDANIKGNVLTVNNIRLVEEGTVEDGVSYELPKSVEFDEQYGELPTPTREGYSFTDWVDAAGKTVTEDSTLDSLKGINLYSTWSENTYNIAFNANGGTGTTAGISNVKYTDSKTLTTNSFTKTGYTFNGWNTKEDGTGTTYKNNATVSKLSATNGATVTLYAQWVANSYTIKFDANKGSGTMSDQTMTYDVKETLATNTFTRTGYTFAGWNTQADGKGNAYVDKQSVENLVTSGTVTLYAQWTPNKYYVTFDVNGDGASCVTSGQNVTFGSAYGTLPTPTRTGYKFNGWFTEAKGGTQVTASTIVSTSKAHTLYAQWTANSYTVTFDDNGGTGGKTVNATYDAAITVPDVSKTGYTLTGWKDANGSVVTDFKNLTTTAGATVTLTAQWTANSYTVTFDANGGSSSESGRNVTFDSAYGTLPTATREGYNFVGWTLNGAAVEANTVVKTASNHSLVAVWQINDTALVEDKVFVDFGLPIDIRPLANDEILNNADNASYTFNGLSKDKNGTPAASLTGDYGSFAVSGEVVTYTPTAVLRDIETVVYYSVSVTIDGQTTTLTSTITVAPATNVYYEESYASTTLNGSNSATLADWVVEGTSTVSKQESSSASDIFGTDTAYNNSTGFSGGTYYKTEVYSANLADNSQLRKSETAKFTFKGTGFDLISACGKTTGMQAIKVSKDGKNIANYLVDTYYDGSLLAVDLLHQVPILSYRNTEKDAWGEYDVEVTSIFLRSAGAISGNAGLTFSNGSVKAGDNTVINTTASTASKEVIAELKALGFGDMCDNLQVIWMDDASVLNGGKGAQTNSVMSGSANVYFADPTPTPTKTPLTNYIDGFRVYNTLDGGNPVYNDSEQNPTYYNIVEEIGAVNNNTFKIIENGTVDFNFGDILFNYSEFRSNGGPKGEIYLKPGQAIAFTFTANSDGTPSKVMLGMRTLDGSTSNVAISTLKPSEKENEKVVTVTGNVTVASATEMYYDISDAGTVENGTVTMAIANTSGAILAVNNLKLVDGLAENEADNKVQEGSGEIIGGNAVVPTPGVPDNTEALPETDVDTESNTPETDVDTEENVGNETENNISAIVPGMPASIASFLELLFELLGQLVGSFGF